MSKYLIKMSMSSKMNKYNTPYLVNPIKLLGGKMTIKVKQKKKIILSEKL